MPLALHLSPEMEAQMLNIAVLRRAIHLFALVGRPVVAATREQRAWHEDDAIAELNDGMLQDIGIDRCQIRHVAPLVSITEGDSDEQRKPAK
jgi:uncharacterized protein YjiS (DUF1127 family)